MTSGKLNLKEGSLRTNLFLVLISHRHDGAAWLEGEDDLRRALSSKACPKAVVTQLKGDWDYFACVLSLNRWKSLQPCFFCTAVPEEVCQPEECTLLSNADFFSRARTFGYQLAAILYLPTLDVMKCICPDWMHTVDLGVGQDVVGGLFYECVSKPGVFPGTTQEARMLELWECIQSFYKKNPPQSKLDVSASNWTIKKKLRASGSDVPSLKSKAAQCRGLQPLIPLLAGWLHELTDTEHSQAVLDLCLAFDGLRINVSSEEFDLEAAKAHLATFLEVYRKLQAEGAEENLWTMKPKCHLLYHLVHITCTHHGRAQHFWNYAEESIGGRYAQMARTRGGPFCRARIARDLFISAYHLQEFFP